jgi:hypothetical protein
MKKQYTFTSKVWLYPGMAGWHFTSVPKVESTAIKSSVKVKAGFGSIPVEVKVGAQVWNTSIFPDKKSGQYLLPIKAAVRKKEHIYADDTITIRITLLV